MFVNMKYLYHEPIHLFLNQAKGTVVVILFDPLCKDEYVRFTTVPLKLLSDKNVKNTVGFLTRKVFICVSFAIASYKQEMCKLLS